jgi:hypothetical protein
MAGEAGWFSQPLKPDKTLWRFIISGRNMKWEINCRTKSSAWLRLLHCAAFCLPKTVSVKGSSMRRSWLNRESKPSSVEEIAIAGAAHRRLDSGKSRANSVF